MKNTMKKILAFILAVCCIFATSSCSPKPDKKLDQAKIKLEMAGYAVSYENSGEYMQDPTIAEYLEAMKGEDYLEVYKFNTRKVARLYYKNLKIVHDAEIDSYKTKIKLIEHTLEKFDENLDDADIEWYENQLKMYEGLLEDAEKTVIGRSGKTVWIGTKDAVKSTK